MKDRTLIQVVALALVFVISNTSTAKEIIIDKWLACKATAMPLAILDLDTSYDRVKTLLEAPPVDPKELWLLEGSTIQFTPNQTVKMESRSDTILSISPLPELGAPVIHLSYAAVYLQVPAWQKPDLSVTGRAPFRLFIDGNEVLSRYSTAASDTEKVSKEVTLDAGWRRLLLITAIMGKDSLTTWSFKAALTPDKDVSQELYPELTLDPRHPFDLTDYGLVESIQQLEISRDGNWLALDLVKWKSDLGGREDHLEVWDLNPKSQRKIWEYRNPTGISQALWSPDGKILLLAAPNDEGKDVYLWYRESNKLEQILTELKDTGSFTWSPDGRLLYYTKTEKYKSDDSKPYKAMWGLEDRWRDWRDNTQIFYYAFNGKAHARLTSGKYNADSFQLFPDGSKILMTRYVTSEQRPYEITEFWLISTLTGESERLFEFKSSSVNHLTISPDGKKIAFDAPMDPVGDEFPDHNDNQTDLWILDLESKQAVNHTRDFEPAVAQGAYGTGRSGLIFWKQDGRIGFTGLYNKKIKLYFYDLKKPGAFDEYPLLTPGASFFRAAEDEKSGICVYQGDILERPGDLYWYDTKKRLGGVLIDLHREYDRLIAPVPRIEDYDYVNSDGVTIPGYLYYPFGYDPAKSYPMVIDFYGGVYGYADGFLWMSHVFANRGYFVYIPTPRGAAGWGQRFADAHPNDWGTLVSRDMNEGVKHLIGHVSGIDGARVAPVSGSYGGFLTMYLLSMPKNHPDYFPYAVGISDYGISNLASYWGVGWWGYLYSDMATARNYPWNAKEYYIEHSPLYSADNITVPLLLLHGDADVNVPVMESDQMYTALKVLGREVEFVRFPGEDHGMVGKRTTYLLSKQMHLEWFDKHLKGLPGAWDERMKDEHK